MASTTEDIRPRRKRLVERFPALRRLQDRIRDRKIPYIQQHTNADCGAACLAMVLAYYGRQVRLDEICSRLQVGRDGASALGLINVGRQYGLRARGISLDIPDLEYLPKASILHWGFNHYVVYVGYDTKSVRIVDPSSGLHTVTLEEFSRLFTGVALLFEPRETFRKSKGDNTNRIWAYVKMVLSNSGILKRILVLSALLQIFGLGLPLLTSTLVDRVIPRDDIGLAHIIAAGSAFVLVFHFLSSFIRSHLLIHLRTELDARTTLSFLEHLFDLPFAFFQIRSAGDLMMRLNSNTIAREIVTSSALSGALDGILVLSYLVLMIWISPMMGCIAFSLGLLRVIIFLAARHRVRDLMAENLSRQAKSQGYQVQMFAGMETLKAVGAEPRALEHWSNLYVDVLNVNIAQGRLDALLSSSIGTLGFASPLILLLVGGHLVIQEHLTLGTMLAVNALAIGFLTPLSSLVNTALRFQQLGGYLDRLYDVLTTPREQQADDVVPAEKLKGHIRLEKVSFSYSPDGPPAVNEVSTEIKPGQFVAIVGRSAAGKTTLANLMLGLYQPSSGQIFFDSKNAKTLDARSIRSQIGVVVQHTHLFGDSIRRNIALANPEMDLETVDRAARLAHVQQDIISMPMGYDTILSDGGLSLSGGQRQRISLARALANNPGILLLDEATSSLDAETERQIQTSLESLGCTRIVIAHRLSTVRKADLILVMDRGSLVQSGRHDDLMAEQGVYAKLFAAQMQAEA